MTVSVKVGGVAKDWKDVDEHWLCKLINGLRSERQSDCVQVHVEGGEIDLALTTPGCACGFGGSRALRGREPAIVELWNKLHLNEPRFSCGNVHAFLVQLRKLL